jgi:hypothetical protein
MPIAISRKKIVERIEKLAEGTDVVVFASHVPTILSRVTARIVSLEQTIRTGRA